MVKFRPGVRPARKKYNQDRTGQDRTTKKSQQRNISHIWGKLPRKDIAMKFGTWVDLPRPPTSPYRCQSLHAGWPPVCSSIFQVSFKIGPVVLPLWMVENRPFPLLWPLAYTTACTSVQAVMTMH